MFYPVYKISLELCTMTLDIQLLVLTKVDSVVTSYIISTPSALRKLLFCNTSESDVEENFHFNKETKRPYGKI